MKVEWRVRVGILLLKHLHVCCDFCDLRFTFQFTFISGPYKTHYPPPHPLLPLPLPLHPSFSTHSSSPHPSPHSCPHISRRIQLDKALTCVWLVAVVALPEVLGVLDDRDTGHADHHRVRASIQRRGCGDAMVDMMEGAGRILLPADHCHGT